MMCTPILVYVESTDMTFGKLAANMETVYL